jgi:hypothetical protein
VAGTETAGGTGVLGRMEEVSAPCTLQELDRHVPSCTNTSLDSEFPSAPTAAHMHTAAACPAPPLLPS